MNNDTCELCENINKKASWYRLYQEEKDLYAFCLCSECVKSIKKNYESLTLTPVEL